MLVFSAATSIAVSPLPDNTEDDSESAPARPASIQVLDALNALSAVKNCNRMATAPLLLACSIDPAAGRRRLLFQ
jgi:hypothetical protein